MRGKRAGKHIPVPPLKDVDAAYIAGIVDADGSIGIYSSKACGPRKVEYHYLSVAVAMRETGAVKFIAERTAGYWTAKVKYTTNRKTHILKIEIRGKRAAAVLKAIRPFMTVKADEAELGIKFYEDCNFDKYGGQKGDLPVSEIEKRRWYEQQLKELKQTKRRKADLGENL